MEGVTVEMEEDECLFRTIRAPPPPNFDYRYSSTVVEDDTKFPEQTWCVAFNYQPSPQQMRRPGSWIRNLGMHERTTPAIPVARRERNLRSDVWKHLFATVGGKFVRVYLAQNDAARPDLAPELLCKFEDNDPGEVFYSCAWMFNADGRGRWWVLAAGEKGLVRVLDLNSQRVVRTLKGHGNAVNDIAIHPHDPALLLTASKDESIRLWNVRTGSTVAVFAGLCGHRGEVISVDIHRLGRSFASSGIDYSIRVWNLTDDAKVRNAILESHKMADHGTNDGYFYYDEFGIRQRARCQTSLFPIFKTNKLHKNYVDCVVRSRTMPESNITDSELQAFVNDLLISKSMHNRLLLIEPDYNEESLANPSKEYRLVNEFKVSGCTVWFIRFGLDRARRLVAIGNKQVSYCTFPSIVLDTNAFRVESPSSRSMRREMDQGWRQTI